MTYREAGGPLLYPWPVCHHPLDLQTLLTGVSDRNHPPVEASHCLWEGAEQRPEHGTAITPAQGAGIASGTPHYQHRRADLGIDFVVEKLGFDRLQVMDARLVRIAPLASNEKHRHAHESIFVVLSGQGELQLGGERLPLLPGSVTCVPRWILHQSHNTGAEEPLVLLAITDFGLTSSVLGDYDRRTRLRSGGSDAFAANEAT